MAGDPASTNQPHLGPGCFLVPSRTRYVPESQGQRTVLLRHAQHRVASKDALSRVGNKIECCMIVLFSQRLGPRAPLYVQRVHLLDLLPKFDHLIIIPCNCNTIANTTLHLTFNNLTPFIFQYFTARFLQVTSPHRIQGRLVLHLLARPPLFRILHCDCRRSSEHFSAQATTPACCSSALHVAITHRVARKRIREDRRIADS
jgi:hypothetical protein